MGLFRKRSAEEWFMLAVGVTIMIMQVKKYYLNTLEMKWEELIIFTIAGISILSPRSLVGAFKIFINTKYGKDTNG
jgi:hypothetical protein